MNPHEMLEVLKKHGTVDISPSSEMGLIYSYMYNSVTQENVSFAWGETKEECIRNLYENTRNYLWTSVDEVERKRNGYNTGNNRR